MSLQSTKHNKGSRRNRNKNIPKFSHYLKQLIEILRDPASATIVAIAAAIIALLAWYFPDIRRSLFPVPTPTSIQTTPTFPSTKIPTVFSTLIPTKVTSTQALSVRGTLCNGVETTDIPIGNRFLRTQGVSAFTIENSQPGSFPSNRARALLIDSSGLWIGYQRINDQQPGGLSHFNNKDWVNCGEISGLQGQNINVLIKDLTGNLWVATEDDGIAMYDGFTWHRFTVADGLLSNKTYGLTVDEQNTIWAGTWEGVSRFDPQRKKWIKAYTAEDGSIFNDHVHAIAFDSQKNIWIGHISDGISFFNNKTGKWIYIRKGQGALCGDLVRNILIRPADKIMAETIWVATSDGGICYFGDGHWTNFDTPNDMPAKEATGLALDILGRVWAATANGTFYFDGKSWVQYTSINSYAAAFGPGCSNCPFSSDDVFTGTSEEGLTHSGLPLPNTIDIQSVCFDTIQGRTCANLDYHPENDLLVARYPGLLKPGEEVRFEVIVSPRNPYELKEGDFLSFIDEDEAKRYGAYINVAVKGTVAAGSNYTFTDFDNPMTMPRGNTKEKQVITNTWRVWMNDRYVGPKIRLEFHITNS